MDLLTSFFWGVLFARGHVAFAGGAWLLKPVFIPGQEECDGQEASSCLMCSNLKLRSTRALLSRSALNWQSCHRRVGAVTG